MNTLTKAAQDVLAERERQISAEGWTPQHDATHWRGEMALAAACYASNAAAWARYGDELPAGRYVELSTPGFRWPWAQEWWKPKSQRRDLIRAAALLLAEIERLDRAAGSSGVPEVAMPAVHHGFEAVPLEGGGSVLKPVTLELPARGVTVRGKTMAELDSDCLREVVKASGFMEHAKPDEDIVAYIKRVTSGVKTVDGGQR